MSREMYNYQRSALKAAKDFNYPKSVMEAIKKATTETKIGNIMHDARNKYLQEEIGNEHTS